MTGYYLERAFLAPDSIMCSLMKFVLSYVVCSNYLM